MNYSPYSLSGTLSLMFGMFVSYPPNPSSNSSSAESYSTLRETSLSPVSTPEFGRVPYLVYVIVGSIVSASLVPQ